MIPPVHLTVDTSQFMQGLDAYIAGTKRALKEIVNQRAFNIAARTIDSMKPAPGAEQATRTKIKIYFDTQISQRIRITAKGRIRKVGKKQNQLQRINLIIQARRRKKGLKGLYGREMAVVEGKLKRNAQVGVGFLKSPFLPIIKGLIPFVRYRKVQTRYGRISVWEGSSGYGRVMPAKEGFNPFVEMRLQWKVSGVPTKVSGLVVPKFQAAFNAEGQEMMRHAASKLQEDANKVNAR